MLRFKIHSLLFGVALFLLPLNFISAQESKDLAKKDSIYYEHLRAQIFNQLDSLEALDSISGDAIIPISRDQAEELITAMILEARKPYVQKMYQDSILNNFKVEKLKERLLDQALRDSYLDKYQERLDRLERLLYALLLSDRNIDPTIIHSLIGGNGAVPMQQYFQQPGIVGYPVTPITNEGGAVNQPPVAAVSDARTPLQLPNLKAGEAIAIAPGAPSHLIKYFMSQVFFGFDSSVLKDKDKKVLDDVAAWMLENNISVSLRGYASLEGNIKYNNKLSARRVSAVAMYLRGKGVPAERIMEIPSGIDSIKEEKNNFPDARRVDIRPILYAEK